MIIVYGVLIYRFLGPGEEDRYISTWGMAFLINTFGLESLQVVGRKAFFIFVITKFQKSFAKAWSRWDGTRPTRRCAACTCSSKSAPSARTPRARRRRRTKAATTSKPTTAEATKRRHEEHKKSKVQIKMTFGDWKTSPTVRTAGSNAGDPAEGDDRRARRAMVASRVALLEIIACFKFHFDSLNSAFSFVESRLVIRGSLRIPSRRCTGSR